MPIGFRGFQKKHIPWNKGRTGLQSHSLESRKKMSSSRKGQVPWNKGSKSELSGKNHYKWKGGLPNCPECGKKLSWYKGKLCRDCNNKINPNRWKGGLTLMSGYHAFLEKKRNLKKRDNGGSHTFEQWVALKEKYDLMCLCCKKTEPDITLTEDHIVPLSKGGTDNISNIQPLCGSCNSRKHTKSINYISLYELA